MWDDMLIVEWFGLLMHAAKKATLAVFHKRLETIKSED